MSWSVNASGKIADVVAALDQQFGSPLADPPAGLSDEGERETVRRIRETITQCLETFDPESNVIVSAYGHMGFDNWDTKAGARQEVTLSIKPGVAK
jgi:hypothetical protein